MRTTLKRRMRCTEGHAPSQGAAEGAMEGDGHFCLELLLYYLLLPRTATQGGLSGIGAAVAAEAA
eukprot:1153362-Pelagomonas_calceolata.AAC.1